jgi:hypothetical protein
MCEALSLKAKTHEAALHNFTNEYAAVVLV